MLFQLSGNNGKTDGGNSWMPHRLLSFPPWVFFFKGIWVTSHFYFVRENISHLTFRVSRCCCCCCCCWCFGSVVFSFAVVAHSSAGMSEWLYDTACIDYRPRASAVRTFVICDIGILVIYPYLQTRVQKFLLAFKPRSLRQMYLMCRLSFFN